MKPVLWFLVFVSTVAFAQKQDGIDSLLARKMVDQKLVGLSVGIIVNGKVIKSRGYGFANIDHSVPANEQTIFKLGSISKHMLAVAIMKLNEEGKLSVGDSVKKYFKDAPETWGGITIRHLLNHTSGLPRESPGFRFNIAQPDSVLIREAYHSPMMFQPGTKWEYCNLGYFILADIIRKVTGLSFSQYMGNEIFSNFGLDNTYTTVVYDVNPDKAEGYIPRGKDSLVKAETQIALRPSGAFVSNISDMLKWEMLMENKMIINGQSWKKMWTDTVLTSRKNPAGGNVFYGYGLQTTDFNNKELIFHGGSLPGFRTMYFRFPAENTAIILLANADQADLAPVAWEIAEILFRR